MGKKTIRFRLLKILLTGKNGQVGFELNSSLPKLGKILAVGRKDCNLNDVDSLRDLIHNYRPNIIINAAAYTEVDKAEKENTLARAINEVAPRILAEEAQKLGSFLIHFSTDYVFDGLKQKAYVEEDLPKPINIYGATKLAGELAVQNHCNQYLILRTSWVVGSHGNNFIKKILDFALSHDKLNIVNDQFGSPTSAKLLSDLTCVLIERYMREGKNFPFGLYHLSATGKTNWHQYACHVISRARILKKKIKVAPDKIKGVPSSEYKRDAKRPCNSVLNTEKFQKVFNINIPSWQKGVDEVIDEMCNEK